ncbi:CoA-transferase family III domain-containing protein [Aspergillus heterothallicus]
MPALDGLRVLELAGLAPGPFAGMMLADNGASVIRVDRVHPPHQPSPDVLIRGKSSIQIDLKSPVGKKLFLRLVEKADVLIDPFRPGVLEKLGLDPTNTLLKLNPRLIVARLTGFRRDGKYANMAGHDINYLAVSGVLSMLGPAARLPPDGRPLPPTPPGNILGDFAAGGHMCVTGIMMALFSRSHTGKGQVVFANMVDGANYLATMPRISTKIPGQWDRPRGENLSDGGCPYYNVYECKDDGKYVAVAGLEPQFFAELVKGLGLSDEPWVVNRDNRAIWPAIRDAFRRRFREKTRKEWENIFEGTDACATPVFTHAELEAGGYEQRPGVTLTGTPSVAMGPRSGWDVELLGLGEGGEQALTSWMGWKKGKEYEMVNGRLRMKEASRL